MRRNQKSFSSETLMTHAGKVRSCLQYLTTTYIWSKKKLTAFSSAFIIFWISWDSLVGVEAFYIYRSKGHIIMTDHHFMIFLPVRICLHVHDPWGCSSKILRPNWIFSSISYEPINVMPPCNPCMHSCMLFTLEFMIPHTFIYPPSIKTKKSIFSSSGPLLRRSVSLSMCRKSSTL